MSSKKVAFVIPLDAKRHLHYRRQLSSLVSPVSDVYIILSRREDAVLWKRQDELLVLPENRLRVIVLSEWIPEAAIATAECNRAMPTFKKWMGLQRLATSLDLVNRYAYYICCDCEVRLLRPLDLDFISSLPTQFVFVGDHVSRSEWHDNFSRQILDKTKSLVDAEEGVLPKSGGCPNPETVYTWWSGLPIYAADTLPDFLKTIGASDPRSLAERLTCTTFDHLVYQRYVLLHGLHHARVVCLTHDLGSSIGWSLECLVTQHALEASSTYEEAGLATLWVSKVTREKLPPTTTERAYIEYHCDRTVSLE